jgi:hypothetical protein
MAEFGEGDARGNALTPAPLPGGEGTIDLCSVLEPGHVGSLG